MIVQLAQAGPVIPTFQKGSQCVRENKQFCWDWFTSHWSEHVPATPGRAHRAHRDRRRDRLPDRVHVRADRLSLGLGRDAGDRLLRLHVHGAQPRLLPADGPVHRAARLSAEIALVSYTLLILFRNTLTGLREVPPDALEAAQAMGLTRRQTLRRVELPLALPAIMAGIRIAAVTIISLATVAAFIGVGGLGQPIFNAIQTGFKTQFVAAGVLAVLLALVTDALLVGVERVLTPWARARVG